MRVCAKQRQRSSTVRPGLNRQPWGILAGSIRHRITKADFRNAPAPPTARFAAVPVFGFDRVENELRYCNMKRGQMSHVGQKRKWHFGIVMSASPSKADMGETQLSLTVQGLCHFG